jgi:N-acetylmuramoyl-L-alanine amidase
MADKKYRKGWPSEKASQHTKAAMAELMAWKPDLHIAIHTNAAGASVQGVRIGYPDIAYNSGETERVANSKRLAELVAQHNARVYHTPSNVKTTTYNFSELNSPTCPAIYIEGCYVHTNKVDAEWWHNNMDDIAASYADGIEAWANPNNEEASFMAYKASVKTKSGGGASIWSDNKKSARVVLVPDGEVLTVTGGYDIKGFAPVEYKSYKGVFDSQYLVRVEAENVASTGKTENSFLEALIKIRKMAEEAIAASKK